MQQKPHYYKRVLANIKANPGKWLGGGVVVFAEKMGEHRALEWANNRVDEGATVMIPHIRDVLMAVVGHPWIATFSVLASYSIVMVAIAHVSAWREQSEVEASSEIREKIAQSSTRAQSASSLQGESTPSTATPHPTPPAIPDAVVNRPVNASPIDAKLSDRLELLSPDGVGCKVWFFHQPETGIDGLLMSFINETTQALKSCKGRVNGAKSFDSKRAIFVDDLTAHALLPQFGDVSHNDESTPQWFIRISSDKTHLEIGNHHGASALRWPPREPIVQVQKWLLSASVEAEGLAPWEFHFRVEWIRPNTIKVRMP